VIIKTFSELCEAANDIDFKDETAAYRFKMLVDTYNEALKEAPSLGYIGDLPVTYAEHELIRIQNEMKE
jgi:hypothetical protein